MFNRFDRIPACDGQTDGRTDRQTSCHGIVFAMHMRRAVKVDDFDQSLYFENDTRSGHS